MPVRLKKTLGRPQVQVRQARSVSFSTVGAGLVLEPSDASARHKKRRGPCPWHDPVRTEALQPRGLPHAAASVRVWQPWNSSGRPGSGVH